MPSLVLVSHSALVARGARELAEAAAQGRARVLDAGGVDEQTLGTSAGRILAALEAADDGEGVLVLVDMGSALLSVEMALELLPDERRARVTVSDAPLVEGAMVAAAQLAAGATLAEAAAEARRALGGKIAHLGGASSEEPAAPAEPLGAGAREIEVRVPNALGLHARPAARVVRTTAGFAAEICVRNLSRSTPPARADSMSALALLDARRGDRLAIAATGPEAAGALEALRALIGSGFGEVDGAAGLDAAEPPSAEGSAAVLRGTAAVHGIARGPALALRRGEAGAPVSPAAEAPFAGADVELSRLCEAMAGAREELVALRARVAARLGEHDAGIFDAHVAFLDDPALREAVERRIREQSLGWAAAWQAEAEELAERYGASSSPVLRDRAADVRDVGARVLAQLGLRKGAAAQAAADGPSILIAGELRPSEAAVLDPARTVAVCMARGGPTSHSVILARALGLPTVVGLGDALLAIPDGAPLLVDGDAGQVLIDPDAERQGMYAERERAWANRRAAARAASGEPAVTRDGLRIAVLANVASPADARAALLQGAEGVGLLRTEFLYLNRELPPDEDEQLAAYRAFHEALGPLPLHLRTFDIGGDKPAPYLSPAGEPNPSLGARGLRLSLAHPALLKAQLRAALRAAAGGVARVMFPMVTTEEDLRRASAALDEARAELSAAGLPQADRVERGIMIEVPSAALLCGALAARVDFISIGTNDLAQYTLAADRANARTAPLADALHPAVLALVERAAQAARAHGRRASVCGELAGDPQAVPLLLGLGVEVLSVSAAAVPGVKAAVRGVSLDEAKELARRALREESAAGVRRVLGG